VRAFHHRDIHHAKGIATMRTSRRSALAFACAALLCAGHAVAATGAADFGYAAVDEAMLLQDDPDGLSLRPGEFIWLPAADARSESPVTMLVSLRNQRGYLYRDGVRIAVTTVSTGTPGHDTPTGVFPIMEKRPVHHSNRYNNAPMPWMQRLTMWGHALHAGQVRAGPASHGCVRLPAEFAKQLFSLTRRGDLVVIAQDGSMVELERAGVDSQVAQLVGSTSRRPPAAERVLAGGEAAAQGSDAGASAVVSAY
jgi:hypothetical protein